MPAIDPAQADFAGSSETGGRISTKLRELYDSIKEEAIPDRFLDLLEKLDEVEKSASAPESGKDRP
ncbi:MAG: NepR family anti-sigma factor [Nitratireductor sp.]